MNFDFYDHHDEWKQDVADFTQIRSVLSRDAEVSASETWAAYLKLLDKNSISLDDKVWGVEQGLSYPESSFAQARTVATFCETALETADNSVESLFENALDDEARMLRHLMLVKLYSLALRRYPQEEDKDLLAKVGGQAHWIKRSAKALVYVNRACETKGFSKYRWSLDELKNYCERDTTCFFLGAINSKAFWLPITALVFEKLSEKYSLDSEVTDFINDFGRVIKSGFFPKRQA